MATNPLPPHESAKIRDRLPERSGTYDTVADKVGLVPNVRLRDNLLQGVVCSVFALLGAFGGLVVAGDLTGVLVGVLLGLLGGVFLSGGVLMVVGLIRR